MTFKHKHAVSSRVTYALQPNGALVATALVVVSSVALKSAASTGDSSPPSMLARAAKNMQTITRFLQ